MKKPKTKEAAYIEYFAKAANYRPAGGQVRACCGNCLYFYKEDDYCTCTLTDLEDDDKGGPIGSPLCVCDFHRPYTKPLNAGESKYEE